MAKRSTGRVEIKKIKTGVPNLDYVLDGGIPELSVSVVAGAPGTGKTVLTLQILFNAASPGRPAVYFATLGEPLVKLIRYQQQFAYFDPAKIDRSIFFVELGQVVRSQGLSGTLDAIGHKVRERNPILVAIDSFRAIEEMSLQETVYTTRSFVHDLAVQLASWGTTSLLVGEYDEADIRLGSEFTVADGILWLTQETFGDSVVRRLQVVKLRGASPQPGRHAFRITSQGIEVFPRFPAIEEPVEEVSGERRLKFGVPGLDNMLHGGLPPRQSTLIAGSSGTGKTLLSLHFIVEGARVGEPAVMVTFEEHPKEHYRKALSFGWDLQDLEKRNLLKVIYLRPVDLSMDEVLARVYEAVSDLKAKRVVINSISGIEVALTPVGREDLREGLHRMVASLTAQGASVVMTTEIPELFGDVRISTQGISFLADNIIVLRYVEIESALQRAVTVVKMRTSSHDSELRRYQITSSGVRVEQPFTEYTGVLSGIPTPRQMEGQRPFTAGLTAAEDNLMRALLSLGEATVEALADAVGAPQAEVRSTLTRLTETGYVIKATRGGQEVYRVALVTAAAPARRPRR